jgi:L-alanine-DL-glutamate epimerase-like enolase superfamily enzyme
MKITYIEIYRFSIPMEPFVIATGTMDYAQNVLVKIHTDTGIYGLGECSAFPMIVGENQDTCLAMAQIFAKILIGKNPLDIANCMQALLGYAAHNATAKSAFDMALYDIAAKNANLPLYQFLGGTKRKIETDMTLGIDSPEKMAKKAVEHIKNGCRIIKIKLGKKLQDDIDRVTAIREAVGLEIALRLDANQGWSFDEAKTALYMLSSHDIEFCEQPMRTWYDDYLPQLNALSPIKLMADESCYNHHDARRLIKSKSTTYLNIKLAKSSGIHEALQIHQVAAENQVSCMIGSMLESRIALSANLHLALACPNIKFFDLDTCLLGHLVDPVIGGLSYDGFILDVPETPGIGADADPQFLANCEHWTI